MEQETLAKKQISSRQSISYLWLVLLFYSNLLSAENNYLFPSDIVNQAGRAVYNSELTSSYKSMAPYESTAPYESMPPYESTAPYESMAPYKSMPPYEAMNSYSAQKKWLYPEQYRPDFSSEAPPYYYPPANRKAKQTPPRSYNHLPGAVRYPGDEQFNRLPTKISEYPEKMPSLSYPQGMRPGYYRRNRSRFVYVTDIEKEDRLIKQNNRGMVYTPQGQTEQLKQTQQIRYIPVPVYQVPGTLPGTVPGVITPGNMVPGYSHLSPDYSYDSYNQSDFKRDGYKKRKFKKSAVKKKSSRNIFSSQYNPMTGFGFPSEMMVPMSVFSDYGGEEFPFTNPDFMNPGIFASDLFLTH